MVDPLVRTRTIVEPGRLLVAALLAVAAFALVISLVCASEWRIDGDLKFLAAVGGTMLNLVTGCIVYAAVRMRQTAAPRSGVLDEDLPSGVVQDAAGAGQDHRDEPELQ